MTEQTAFTGPTGRTHTMNCVTVQHWHGGGDKRGASPDLRPTTMADALEHIKRYPWAECRNCRVMRLKAEAEHHTADGTLATPVEGEPLMWLVRASTYTWWVVELESRDGRIEDIDLNRLSARDSGFSVPATATRTFAADGAMDPGWYTEVKDNHSTEPYRRMQDAVDAMLLEIAQNRAMREEQAAKHNTVVQETASEPETGSLAAEDFRPGYRYWSVRPGCESAWTITSVRIFESQNAIIPGGQRYTTLVEHVRRDGTTRVFKLGEKIAIQGPWKTEA